MTTTMTTLAARYTKLAQRLGSKAETLHGAVRAIRQQWRSYPQKLEGKLRYECELWYGAISRSGTSAHWECKQLLAPEERRIRRLRHDRVESANLLREAFAKQSTLMGTIEHYRKILSTPYGHEVSEAANCCSVRIPCLRDFDAATVPVQNQWSVRSINTYWHETVAPSLIHRPHTTVWKNGKPRTGDHARYDVYVMSIAWIDRSTGLLHYIREYPENLSPGKRQVVVGAAAGCRWDIDDNGLRLLDVATGDDYHPSDEELLRCNPSQTCVYELRRNAEKRRAEKAAAVAEAAAAEGVMVCLADSIRAGNCRTGSESFAARHQLDPRRHYHARELASIANGDSGRVRLAISSAVRRHMHEMAQGFCALADHRCN
jgi:hypothetical protein